MNSIFYVGKGKNSRSYSHLYEAHRVYKREIEIETIDCSEQSKHLAVVPSIVVTTDETRMI